MPLDVQSLTPHTATDDRHRVLCRVTVGKQQRWSRLHTDCLDVTAKGKPVDATQELLAVGICNIGNSFVQAFPGTGSLSRSAVNNSSGVRTPLGGLYTGMPSILFRNQEVSSISL